MNESIFRLSGMRHHNDDDPVKASRMAKSEKTKLSLRHIRKVHRIKSDALGHCYRAIGDSAWQLLCEIHLHNIDHVTINQAMIEQSMDLTPMIAKRYLEILQTEKLLEISAEDRDGYQNLQLTDFGRLKVLSIIDECAEAFASGFIYSQIREVESD